MIKQHKKSNKKREKKGNEREKEEVQKEIEREKERKRERERGGRGEKESQMYKVESSTFSTGLREIESWIMGMGW